MSLSLSPRHLLLVLCVVCAGCGDDAGGDGLEDGEWLPGGDTTNTLLLGSNAFARHVSNITDEHESMFFTGNALFNQPWVEAPASTTARDGLGPLFNARSCSGCHFRDGRGQPPEDDEAFLGLLLRLSTPGANDVGGPLPDPNYGGQLQPHALPDVPSEGFPRVEYTEINGTFADGTPYTLLDPTYQIDDLALRRADARRHHDLAPRVAPQVIGHGLLEAIPDESRILELADPDDERRRRYQRASPTYVWDVDPRASCALGRFGWKSRRTRRYASRSAGAFLGDMGITTPVFGAGELHRDAQPECSGRAVGWRTRRSTSDQLRTRRRIHQPSRRARSAASAEDDGCAARSSRSVR